MKSTHYIDIINQTTPLSNFAAANYAGVPMNVLGADFLMNRVFSYVLNYKDLYNYQDPRSTSNTNHIRFYKGYSDRTRRNTVMQGGLNYCLETMKLNPIYANAPHDYPIEIAKFRRAQAYNCAAQYIGLQSLMPWHDYEPSGSPLKLYTFPDNEKVAEEFCQPLKSGVAVDLQLSGDNKPGLGMAPVWHSNHPLLNENEYSLSKYLRISVNKTYYEDPPLGDWTGTRHSPWAKDNLPFTRTDTRSVLDIIDDLLPKFNGNPTPNSYKPVLFPGYIDANAGIFHDERLIAMPCLQNYMVSSYNSPNLTDPPAPDEDIYQSSSSAGEGTPEASGVSPAPAMAQTLMATIAQAVHLPEVEGIDWLKIFGATPAHAQGVVSNPCSTDCKRKPLPALYLAYNPPQPELKMESYCPKVERIVDVSHPFSPRHDIVALDRDYSAETSKKIDVYCKTNLVKEGVYSYTRYSDPEGPWKNSSYQDAGGEQLTYTKAKELLPTVQCAVVPVEIPSFRAADFNACMGSRIEYNHIAFKDYVRELGTPTGFVPPCATRYFDVDSPTSCPMNFSVQQCCAMITKPVVPINLLKIRTAEGINLKPADQPGDKYKGVFVEKEYLNGGPGKSFFEIMQGDGNILYISPTKIAGYDQLVSLDPFIDEVKKYAEKRPLPSVEPPDYIFGNYVNRFEDPRDGKLVGFRMPYMRWWDTGAQAGNPWKLGSFVNTAGGWDTLVGVGREGRDSYEFKETQNRARDESWLLAAKNELNADHLFGRSNREAGNIGGWPELMLHQMYTRRFHNLNCLGRYERLFKEGDADNYTHYAAGGSFTNRLGKSYPWPLSWRGYAIFINGIATFFGPPHSAGLSMGLDYVQPGDIAIFNFGGITHPMFIEGVGFDPRVTGQSNAVATYANGCHRLNGQGNCLEIVRLYVRTWNQGKFPSAAGVTNQWGMGPTRVFFRDVVPETYLLGNRSADNLLAAKLPVFNNGNHVGWQPSCSDPDYTVCALPFGWQDWQRVPFYRPNLQQQYICNYTNWPVPALASTISSAFFSKCIADGMDPPLPYRTSQGAGLYKGAGTGAISKTSFCSPVEGSCGPLTGEAPVPNFRERK